MQVCATPVCAIQVCVYSTFAHPRFVHPRFVELEHGGDRLDGGDQSRNISCHGLDLAELIER